MQAAGAASGAADYAYDQAQGLKNSAGQSWDESMNAAYRNWQVGGWVPGPCWGFAAEVA